MAFPGKTTTFLLHLLLLMLPLSALAQFQFFEQMFNNPSQAQQHAQHSPQQQNVASDSSWYRRNYEGGEPFSSPSPFYPFLSSGADGNRHEKRIAAITYAQERWHAYISHIIAHARGRCKRINLSWERAVRFVLVRKGGRKGSWGGGWNWLGRAGFEIIFEEGGGGRQS